MTTIASIMENAFDTCMEDQHTKQRRRNQEKSYSNNDDTSKEQTPYDSVCPKNEILLMRQLRKFERKCGFVTPIIWSSSIAIIVFHLCCLMSAFVIDRINCRSVLFGVLIGMLAGFGVTGGAHRYWCHRSYKATLPLQWILIICYSFAGQNSIYNWVRDHRVHHKYSESDADPHNAHRGFFFSHVGWLMMKKHPEVIEKGNKLDMSDITTDPLIQFHTKYFYVFKGLLCFILPTLIPVYCWDETWTNSIISQPLIRYMCSLHFTWSVNSFAHMFGYKPYDINIMPVENWTVSIFAMGEGWHNYHHTFPWDYKAAELGTYWLNVTTLLLDGFAKIGWVYDAKSASDSLIRSIIDKRGDKSGSFHIQYS